VSDAINTNEEHWLALAPPGMGKRSYTDRVADIDSMFAELVSALRVARQYIYDDIGESGARVDFKDTQTINVIDNAIARAEGRL